jgi:hypothetical protein
VPAVKAGTRHNELTSKGGQSAAFAVSFYPVRGFFRDGTDSGNETGLKKVPGDFGCHSVFTILQCNPTDLKQTTGRTAKEVLYTE